MPESINPHVRLAVMGVERFTSAMTTASRMVRAMTFSLNKFSERQARQRLSKRAFRRWRGKRKAARREALRLRDSYRDVYGDFAKEFYANRVLGETYMPREIGKRPELGMPYSAAKLAIDMADPVEHSLMVRRTPTFDPPEFIPIGHAAERIIKDIDRRIQERWDQAVTNALLGIYIKQPGEDE